MGGYGIKFGEAILWVLLYFGIMLFYTFLDVAVWRKILPSCSNVLHVITMGVCVWGFIRLLKRKGFEAELLSNISLTGVLLALGCSMLFYIVLDKGLDPVFEKMFPGSEQDYQETVKRFAQFPVTGILQVCILAPVAEEVLMRGVVLGGLGHTYGAVAALLVSSFLFALLHFNMVQTLSAFVCGLVLGLLYIKTDSILCCMIAHCGYNLISYLAVIERYGSAGV